MVVISTAPRIAALVFAWDRVGESCLTGESCRAQGDRRQVLMSQGSEEAGLRECLREIRNDVVSVFESHRNSQHALTGFGRRGDWSVRQCRRVLDECVNSTE